MRQVFALACCLLPGVASAAPTLTVLYSFQQASHPLGPVGVDKHGNILGTTNLGGTANNGEVFELSSPANGVPPYTETLLYQFGADFRLTNPGLGLAQDASGNF